MKIFDKNIIVEFSQPVNRVDGFIYGDFFDILCECADELNGKAPLSDTDYKIQLINEYATNSATINSDIEVAFIINSPQIEINSIKRDKNHLLNFWTKLKISWKNIHNKKKKKKHSKKNEENNSNENVVINTELTPEKYTLSDFANDMMAKLTNYFTDSTTFYQAGNIIKIYSKDELSKNIIVYIGLKNQEDGFKIYNKNYKKLIDVNFGERFDNYELKEKQTKGCYASIIRIFNNISKNIINFKLNQILVESVFFNVPNNLYKKQDIAESFIQIINYLNINTMQTFVSIRDKKQLLINDSLINDELSLINSTIQKIMKQI